MTSRLAGILIPLIVFSFSAYVMIDSSLKKQRDQQEVIQELNETHRLSEELKESMKANYSALLDDPKVIEFLAYENRDSYKAILEGDHKKLERMTAAAQLLLTEFASCVSDGSHCGVNTEGWDEYFGMGMPPLHEALVRALNFTELTKTRVDKNILFKLFKAPSYMLSYTAASQALNFVEDEVGYKEVLLKSRALQDRAKADFFAYYAASAASDELFVNELVKAVNSTSDSYTRSEVLSQIEKFNLDEAQFRFVSYQACKGVSVLDEEDRRSKLVNLMHKKAKGLGFRLSQSQLCSLPEEFGEG